MHGVETGFQIWRDKKESKKWGQRRKKENKDEDRKMNKFIDRFLKENNNNTKVRLSATFGKKSLITRNTREHQNMHPHT